MAAALTLAALPTGLGAQAADSLDRVLEEVPDDRGVRVEVRGDTVRPVGRLGTREAEAFTLRTADGERRVPTRAVERLWVRVGHRGGNGALIGGAIGFGVGALVTDFFFGEVASDPLEASVRGGILFGLVGAGVGYIAGQSRTDWDLRFEAGEGRVGLRVEMPALGGG